MNATLIPSIIISIFLVFVILGFVFGWFRGLYKSLIRFIMVLGMGVLAFFVIPPLAEAILQMDISKMNIVIGNVHVITIQDLVTDLLRQIPIVEDIIEASPTFETFIEVLPMMIANVLLFVLFFFVFKWVSMIIYWIVAGVFFSKKKTEGKEKHGFVGAVIGALQGFVVACIVLVPIFGFVQTSKPIIMAVQQEQEASVSQSTFIEGVYYAEPEGTEGAGGSGEQTNEDNSVQATVSTVERYTKAFEDCWVSKMLKAIGVQKLSVNMFDKLSTIEQRNVDYSLMREIDAVAKAYPELQTILDSGFNIEDNETLDALTSAIDDLYTSPVLSGMVKEIVPEVADRWLNDGTFCQISKPTFDDASLQRFFDVLLLNLSTAEGDTIKNDITTGVDLLKVANNANLIKTIIENGDIIELLSQDSNSNLIDDIITTALESNTLKAVLPELINVAMDFVYRALDIDPATIEDVGSNLTIDWEFEKPRLVGIFKNVIDIVDAIGDGAKADPAIPALECIDFAKLGSTFDNIRYSTLLGPASKQIMNALLSNTNIVGEESTVLNNFISSLNEVWEDKTISLESTFISIGDALILAKDLKNNASDFDSSNIGEIITGLTNNEALKDVVNEVVSVDTLKDLGLDDKTAGIVNETISSVINGNYAEGSGNNLEVEAKAVEEVFDLANKVINLDTTADPEAKVEVSETEAGDLVASLAESTILLDTITTAGSDIEGLDISDKLSEEAKENILTEINKLEDEDPAKAKLIALFGMAL